MQKDVKFTSGQPKSYRSSSQAVRQFCGNCGSQLAFQYDDAPEELDVSIATLDNPDLVRPVAHIYTASKLSFTSTEGLPCYPGGRG
jgi:hypothetical protein